MKELINGIKERYSNTFFFSFVASWLILNWEIPIALLFHNNELLQRDCSETYVNFINNYLSNIENQSDLFWSPVGYAFILSILFPIIKFVINIWGVGWETIYEILRESFTSRWRITPKKFYEMKSQKEDFEKKYIDLAVKHDNNFLEGNWLYKINNITEKIQIKDGEIYRINKDGIVAENIAIIKNFKLNGNDISFIKITNSLTDINGIASQKQFLYNELKLLSVDQIQGNENNNKVFYIKIHK